MPLTLGCMVAAAAGQLSCDLGGETAILNTKSGRQYRLDEVGARIWGLIREPVRVVEIRDTLLEEYEVSPEQCEADLIDLLEKLAGAGLVNIHGGSAA